jgi:hypothetical protein
MCILRLFLPLFLGTHANWSSQFISQVGNNIMPNQDGRNQLNDTVLLPPIVKDIADAFYWLHRWCCGAHIASLQRTFCKFA